MDCSLGNPLSEDDLLRALDGEAPADVAEHLSRCAYCQARLDRIALFEDRLQSLSHPSPQLLLEYQFNMVTPAEMDTVGAHLDHCAHCRSILAEYAAASARPSPSRRATVAPNANPAAPSPTFSQRLRDVVIRLTTPSLPGIETAGDSSEGHFIAAAPGIAALGDSDQGAGVIATGTPGVSLFLSLEMQDDSHYTVYGHVAAEDQAAWNNAAVGISQSERVLGMTLLDDMGQFTCPGLAAGTYRLRIRAVSGEIVIFEPLIIP